MIWLAVSSLRHRLFGVAAMFLAVFVGAALFLAAGGIFETALRLDVPPQRLAGAPLLVAGPSSYEFSDHSDSHALSERAVLDPAVTAQVAAMVGVGYAVADVSFPAALISGGRRVSNGPDQTSGHPWASAELTPYTLTGRAPASAREVVVDSETARAGGVHIGDDITAVVDGTPGRFTVSGLADASTAVSASALFFSDARGHAPEAIGIFPAPGTSVGALAQALAAAVPVAHVTIATGSERGTIEFTGVGGVRLPLVILSAVFGGFILVVMGIVVAATTTLSIQRRHRELALLRATGATPKQTTRMVLAEAVAVATVGAVAGTGVGGYGGRVLFDQLRAQRIIPAALVFHQGPIPYAAAVTAAVGSVWAATTLAARPAARVTPIEALREAALPRTEVGRFRRVLATVLACATGALAVVTVFMGPEDASVLGGPAVLTGSIAVALVAPAGVAQLARRYARTRSALRGVNGRLASVNLRARAIHYGAVLVPITIGTAIALGNVYSQTTQDHAARAAYLDDLRPDLVLTSDTGGFDPSTAAEVAALPGVTGVSPLVISQGWLEQPFDPEHTSDPLRLLGLAPEAGDPLYTAPVVDGSMKHLQPGSVALPAALADELSIQVGDHVTVRLGDGAHLDATVAATLDQPSGYEQLVLPAGVLAAHTTTQLIPELLIRTGHPGEVTTRIRGLFTGPPGIDVGGSEMLAAQFDAGLGVQAWINYLIAALALAYAALATINTLAVSILDRRRELGLHRLIGATRREVTKMLYREVNLVGAFGYLAGVLIAGISIWPISIASGQLLPSGPWWVLAGSLFFVMGLLWPVTAVTARIAMHQPAAAAATGP